MSSSAFTPSTTTVTNNVPVNVPVVTDWVSYTPTLTNFTSAGTNASNSGRWRRAGDSMEIVISTRMGSTGTASGVFYWGLPSGFTVDATKLPTGGSGIRSSPGSIVWFDRSANQFVNAVPSVDTSLNAVWAVVTGTGLPSNIESTNVPTNSDDSFSISVRVPIAEWAGSGTTTLATRAVEEYAWNSSASTTTDSTSFGNGPDGVNIRAFAPSGTTSVNKRVRFQNAILPTDFIVVEVDEGTNSQRWVPIDRRLGGYGSDAATATISFGTYISQVNSTDIDVRFFNRMSIQTADTWSVITSWKWRVRKVSGGAAVGFPVSARNIVGDTSGSVVPVGMLGEVRNFTSRTIAALTSGMTASAALDTLPQGRWLVIPNASLTAATGATLGEVIISSNNANDNTGSLGSYSAANTNGVTAGNWTFCIQNFVIDVQTSQIIYAKAQSSGANRNISVSGFSIRIS